MDKKSKDEQLQFLLYPHGYSIWKYVKYITVVFLMIWLKLNAYYMMTDRIFRKEYLPNLLTGQVVVTCNIVTILLEKSKKVSVILDKIEECRLPWSTAGEETYKKISLEIQMLKRKMILLMIGNSVVCVTIFPFPNLCQPFHRVGQEHFPKWLNIIDILVIGNILLTGYGATCFSYKLMYVTRHLKILCYLLNGLMKNISFSATEGIDDVEYQKFTQKKLVLLVKIHRNIKRLLDMSVKSMRWIFHPAYLSATLSIVSTFYFFIIKEESLLNPRLLFCYIVHGYQVSILLETGQQLSDEYEYIFGGIYELPWYTWNRTNKQIALQLMINSMEPIKLSSFGLMSLDYSLSIKIGKICWSMIAVLKTLNV